LFWPENECHGKPQPGSEPTVGILFAAAHTDNHVPQLRGLREYPGINGAAMKTLGSYPAGTMLFLGVGTGLGSASSTII
jgi:hypothetical protein